MKKIKNMSKKGKIITLAGVALVMVPIIILICVYALNVFKKFVTPEEIEMITHGNIWLEGGLVLILFIVKSVFFFIPIAFIYVVTGALFDPITAIILNILGLCFCLSGTFFIGKALGKSRVAKLIEKSPRIKQFMDNPQKSDITLFVLRISGLFPVELISVVCGCSGYKYLKFIVYSVVAMLPMLIPFSIAGTSITNPFSPAFIIPITLSIVIAVASILFYKKMQK